MSDKISIKHHTSGTVEVVKVNGFMDMLHVGQFATFLDNLIAANSFKIVLDFTDLDYISSAGLGVIIGRIREVRAKSGDILIGGCSHTVEDILVTFGFTSIFTMCPTPQDALNLFEKRLGA